MNPGSDKKEIIKAFALFTQLGITMGVCVFMGFMAGKYLDKLLGTSPVLLLLGCLVGVLSAFKVFYDMVVKEWSK